MFEKNENYQTLSFCVVVPMYNEEDNAEKCVTTILAFLKEVNSKAKLIVVDDGCSDNTTELLLRMSEKDKKLVVEIHGENMGYGQANLTGARRAYKEGFEYVIFMDADLTQNVKYVLAFLDEMKKGTDFIKATRYAKGGSVEGVEFKRYIVSFIGNMLARIVFRLPLTDYTNGFRAVKTKILALIQCEEKGFGYLLEEVNKISKITNSFGEIPYILTVREKTFSRSKFSYSFPVYYRYLRWIFKR